ncbi:hypothetical protein [Amycolatopsis sp. cmx-4-54]|uniref:hypothetical protein n=1 Tax=Amycolatopsis sp. cmx-4-54 TaxID=2790936 RepID=UPI00397BC656
MANSAEANNLDALAAVVKKSLNGLSEAKALVAEPVRHAAKILEKPEQERMTSDAKEARDAIDTAEGLVLKIVLQLQGAAKDRRRS